MITLKIKMTKEQWIETVHALSTKIEIVENISDHDVDRWLKDLVTAYNEIYVALADKGIEA